MATLIRIGNSQGIRIPKATIEQAQLNGKELDLKVVDDGLLIQPVDRPRKGWRKQFEKASAEHRADGIDEEWLDASLAGDEEWEW